MTLVYQVRVLAEESCGNGRRVVGGCVVYDQNPYVHAFLVKEALDTTRQIVGVVVRGDNDINPGHIQRPG
jgi:hypothetical protein